MIRHERGKFLKPEMRDLREHFAFARNAVGHDDVEGGDAVAGDEQEAVAEVEDFADFAGANFFDAGQIKLENRCVVHRAKNKVRRPKFKVQSDGHFLNSPTGVFFAGVFARVNSRLVARRIWRTSNGTLATDSLS